MSAFGRLYRGENNFDFTKFWRIGLIASAALVTISLGAILLRGLNLGIEFEGGTAWEVQAPNSSVADTRDALRPVGEDGATIQTVGGDIIRVQSSTESADHIAEVREALGDMANIDPTEVGVTTVGPSWGQEISSKALRALIFFFIAIAIYISVRLEWKMAVGALLAVFHDIVLTVGIYALFQLAVTPATVIAFLTILGYSLYDTIVVYDKVRENTIKVGAANQLTYTGMMSRSMNQVLMRSLNTTITSVLPVASMLIIGSYILGATTLREFALALLIGLIAGAYSSIFIAAPVVAWLKEREPENQLVKSRIESGDTGEARSRLEQAKLDAASAKVSAKVSAQKEKSGGTQASTGVLATGKKKERESLPSGYQSATNAPRGRKKRK